MTNVAVQARSIADLCLTAGVRHACNSHGVIPCGEGLHHHTRGDPSGSPGSKGRAMRELFLVEETESEELGWQERALCAQTDPEAFFPEKGGSTREAKRVCRSCEVRAECLEYALEHDERFGIWGGMSERERRRLKRQAI